MELNEIKIPADEIQELNDYLLLDSRRYDTNIGVEV